jgi:hypothetical protein
MCVGLLGCLMGRASHEPWGDGESVALVSSRVPVDMFARECAEVFDRRYFRCVVRVFRADLLPHVASRLRPQGLRTFCAVDPSLPVRRWLVWSVGESVALASGVLVNVDLTRKCGSCGTFFTHDTCCYCGGCVPF